MSHVIVFVTASSREEADRIGRALVDEHLAACANLVPSIASRYTVPEVVALPILGGNPDYLRWIDESVTDERQTDSR